MTSKKDCRDLLMGAVFIRLRLNGSELMNEIDKSVIKLIDGKASLVGEADKIARLIIEK